MSAAAVELTDAHTVAALHAPVHRLAAVLHDIAQPLTILAALLDEATPEAQRNLGGDLLIMARGECQRAIAAVRSLQDLSLAMAAKGEVKETQ